MKHAWLSSLIFAAALSACEKENTPGRTDAGSTDVTRDGATAGDVGDNLADTTTRQDAAFSDSAQDGGNAAVDATGDTKADGLTPPADVASSDAGGDAGDGGRDGGIDCMPTTHPGTVTFVDEEKGTTTVENAASVPDSIKWKMTTAGRVPVVKVIRSRTASGAVELRLYGPCGQLLEVVLGTTPPG